MRTSGKQSASVQALQEWLNKKPETVVLFPINKQTEDEEHARQRLRAHWPGMDARIDICLERIYHPSRRN